MSLKENKADITNVMFGLEHMDSIRVKRTPVPTEADYEASFEGGLESELNRLDKEATDWQILAVNIGAESVYSNLAIKAIMDGVEPKKAFNMYGFEADEAEAEQAIQKEGFMKRIWSSLSGYFANFVSYAQHILKIQLISGRVFGNIYKETNELLNKVTEANQTKGTLITDSKFTQPVDLIGAWKVIEETYTTSSKYTPLVGEDVAELKKFIQLYAGISGVELVDGVLTMDKVKEKYDTRDEALELAELKNTQERAGAGAVNFVTEALKFIADAAQPRANQPGAKQDALKDFKSISEDAKRIFAALKDKAEKAEEADKEELSSLSTQFKAISQLIQKQSKVYNKCLKQFAKVSDLALDTGKAVLKELEAAK